MKVKILMLFSVFALLISAISVNVGATELSVNGTESEVSDVVYGHNLFNRCSYRNTDNIGFIIDNNTSHSRIALEGAYSYPLAIYYFNFLNDMSIFNELISMNGSFSVYDYIEGNYISTAATIFYMNAPFIDNRYVYTDFVNYDTATTSLVDNISSWENIRYFEWDFLQLDYNSRNLDPNLIFLSLQNLDFEIEISYDYKYFNYDTKTIDSVSVDEIFSTSDFLEISNIDGQAFTYYSIPLFGDSNLGYYSLYNYTDLPTYIFDLKVSVNASDVVSIFWGITYTLTDSFNYDLFSNGISYLPDSIVNNDIDFVNWLVRGVSGVFDTELIPGISMGNILKLVLSIALVVAVLKYFVGG